MNRTSLLAALVCLVALLLSGYAVLRLEAARSGLLIEESAVGTTPVTIYSKGQGPAPLVVVAHGFAGSRQLMQAFSLTLARSGYTVMAFDFEGHGRNPVPMSGDVDAIEGTTELLVAETLRVLAAGLRRPDVDGRAALLGHSMASDVVVRAALRSEAVEAVVAVSMFSAAVSPDEPRRLLAITGEWEPYLREAALDALRLVDPSAREGDTARNGSVLRRAVVAPHVEHVGVLYSTTSLAEARDWLDAAFGRADGAPPAALGPWIALLLASIVALAWPLSRLLPAAPSDRVTLASRSFVLLTVAPAAAVPFAAVLVPFGVLPVLVADYLMVHLALYGLLQLAGLWRAGIRPGWPMPLPVLALLVWAIAVFGLALDRYGASFWPTEERAAVIAVLCLGAVPFMLADAMLLLGTDAGLLRRLFARFCFLASLGIAVALDPERLFFLVMILPVILLYFLTFGLMGRWVGRRSGAGAAGLALGLILAWSLGVSFPMFDPSL